MSRSGKLLSGIGLLALVVAGAAFVAARSGGDRQSGGEAPPAERAKPVSVTECLSMTFEDRVDVSGNVLAKDTALVSARVAGTLDQVFVDEGDKVEAGRTRLFQTDKVTLVKAEEAARQQVAVAAAAVLARAASIRRIEAELKKVRLDAERYRRLYENDHAITKNALELQESSLEQVEATLAEANAALALAEAQATQARSAHGIAQKNLSDSLVVAPISGTVSERMLEPGEHADTQTTVLGIVDLSRVEVSAFLPEHYYQRVAPGGTAVRLSAGDDTLGEFSLSYRSPVIDPRLRTFEIKVLLSPPPAGVVPGRLMKVGVVIARQEGLGVPRGAVLERAGEDVVFVVEEGRARRIRVQTGLQTESMVEVSSPDLSPGMMVVTEGQRFCEDGAAVRIVGEGR